MGGEVDEGSRWEMRIGPCRACGPQQGHWPFSQEDGSHRRFLTEDGHEPATVVMGCS